MVCPPPSLDLRRLFDIVLCPPPPVSHFISLDNRFLAFTDSQARLVPHSAEPSRSRAKPVSHSAYAGGSRRLDGGGETHATLGVAPIFSGDPHLSSLYLAQILSLRKTSVQCDYQSHAQGNSRLKWEGTERVTLVAALTLW